MDVENPRALLALTLLSFAAQSLAASPQTPEAGDSAAQAPVGEVKLWKETGQTLDGFLEVQLGAPVSVFEMGEVDSRTYQILDRLQARLMASTPKDKPPLKYVVPAEERSQQLLAEPTVVGGASRAANDFTIYKNTAPSGVATGFTSTVNEPAVATSRNTVLYTGNWYAAASSDRGETFTFVNPFAGPFPPPDNGFCCDQVTEYDPGTDVIFWLQQSFADTDNGTHRINVDQGADGTFDCFYNITPSIFGFGTETWPDFPDLALSDDYLYHSANVYSTTDDSFQGAFVSRYPTAELGSCTSVPFKVYQDTGGFFSFKLTRGATDTMYFADHISTASMRIWRWPEAADAPTAFDRSVTAWNNATRVCPGPDARDWCGFIDRRLAAAWVADGMVGFMWMPSQGSGFAYPYTRIARFSEIGLTLASEPVIWSDAFAWVYPAVAVDRNGDLGGTIMAGGGASLYPSCVVWLADNVNGDTIAPLENTVAFFGTSGPSTNRSGDYSSVEPYHPYDLLFSGACFGLDSTSTGASRYVLFGREAPCSTRSLSINRWYTDLAGHYRSERKISAAGRFRVTPNLPVEITSGVAVVMPNGVEIEAGAEFAVRIDPTLNCSSP